MYLNLPFLLIILVTIMSACSPNNNPPKDIPELKQKIQFDSLLAMKYGADEYGMKTYVMAFLKRGPNRDRTEEESAALQRAHMENINRLVEEGKMVLAGPYLDDTDLRGIYVFVTEDIKEAEEWTKTDPAIQAGSLILELHPWYASAALMGLVDMHLKIAKTPI